MTLKAYSKALVDLVGRPGLLLLTTSSGFRTMTQRALQTFLPVYMVYVLGMSTAVEGLGLSLLQVAGLVASPLASTLSDRVGRRRVTLLSTVLTAVAVVVMALMRDQAGFFVMMALTGFFLYALRPIMQAWMMEIAPDRTAGASVGLLFSFNSLGGVVAPLLGGLVADRFGLQVMFYLVAAMILSANVLILLMRTDGAPPAQAAPLAEA